MNNQGDVVGHSACRPSILNRLYLSGASTVHAFLWTKGKMQDLGTLPGDPYSRAMAINDRGQIAGVSGKMHGDPWRAFLWEKRRMTALPNLPGHQRSHVNDMNNDGWTVGFSQRRLYKQPRGVLWHSGSGTVYDLNQLLTGPAAADWEIREAKAINAGRQIIGTGSLRGKYRFFLLTPI